jgi:hypothetical protein
VKEVALKTEIYVESNRILKWVSVFTMLFALRTSRKKIRTKSSSVLSVRLSIITRAKSDSPVCLRLGMAAKLNVAETFVWEQ